MEYKNNYPVVFIHGLGGYGEPDLIYKIAPYWGAIGKDAVKHYRERGIETYCPSLGPFNSAWDRACALWAYLFGGTVDFGKVHSEKHGHARYGHTYEHGVLEDLGTTEAHKKINLIAHSFGGPTVKEIAALFAYGSEEERAGTPEDELSPLFAGGHANLIHTITTCSGVNNGTTCAERFGIKGMSALTYFFLGANTLIGDTFISKIYNFRTSHFGIMPDEDDIHVLHFRLPWAAAEGIRAYDSNKGEDSSAHEMQVSVVQTQVNTHQPVAPNIYYFAHRADGTVDDMHGGRKPIRHPDFMCRLTYWFSKITTYYQPDSLKEYGVGDDVRWKMNDGFVNVVGQSAPLNAPFEEADFDGDFKPGKWYNMPVIRGDHLTWNGFEISKEDYYEYFDRMIDTYRNLPDGDSV